MVIPLNLSAQIAGEIPNGGSLQLPDIYLQLYENYHDTMTYLDIDADGYNDIKITLYKGYPPHDAPNVVFLETPGNKYALCVDSTAPDYAVHYNQNDSICIGSNVWGADSIYYAGCYAGWSCSYDTSSIVNKYLAYKNIYTGDIGWLKFSMKLYAQTEPTDVSFSVSEMVGFNLNTNLKNISNEFQFTISPNPLNQGSFSIQSTTSISRVDVYTLSGVRMATYLSNPVRYHLPVENGLYIVRAYDSKGRSSTTKLVKL